MGKIFLKVIGYIFSMAILLTFNYADANAQNFIEMARETGITIKEEGNIKIWQGPFGGKTKPGGPLAGKKIGILAASEFSDFQAHYLASYVSEFGGNVEFLLVDWVTWKFTRPNVKSKGVKGMWGMGIEKEEARYTSKSLKDADLNYDALVVPGGHSADVMVTEKEVIDFIETVYSNGAVLGAVGGGSIPLIGAGIMNGKTATGNNVVSFMLKRTGTFKDAPVVSDGRVITARNTVDTPDFVRELCRVFDPEFIPEKKGILAGKRVLIIAGEDFEDIELSVPVMEFIYRDAEVIIGTFDPPMRSRPPILDSNVVQGNYGMSVPLQEISLDHYRIVKLSGIEMADFDVVFIPGAFGPWNMIMAGEPVEFLKNAHNEGKIIAAICHGPIALAAADLVKGKKIAGWLACKDAVNIMGGTYDYSWAAVIDGRIVTGRTPPEVPEFIDAVTTSLLSP